MDSAYTVGIAPGDGLIGRFGDTVMYTGDASASAARMLAAVEAEAGARYPGAAIAERLAALNYGADPVRTPFGVVAPAADGLLVLVRGNVVAAIDAGQDTHELSGQRAFTWVDEIVSAPVRRIAIASGSRAPAAGCPHTDLRTGVVPGGGFILCRADDADDRPARPESIAAETMRGLEPTQTAPPLADTAPGDKPGVESSTFVAIAGVLQSEDGARYPLDRNYAIGRNPLRDAAVANALASPIVVPHDKHISRVHAYVSIDSGNVFVRDASTPGGTFIAAPGAEGWTRISSAPTELEPGWSLRVGDWILTYHAGNPD